MFVCLFVFLVSLVCFIFLPSTCLWFLQPPTQNMPMGPGGMNQSGPPPQPPHGHSMPSEGMVSSGPPAPHIPNQMNGQMPGEWTPLSPAWPLKSPLLVSPLFFFLLLSPQSLPHLCCLATPQNCEGGRCYWTMTSSLCQLCWSRTCTHWRCFFFCLAFFC